MKNHYQILGVQPTASKEEIKSAYLKLSKKMHPDMNNGDEFFTELFKNINEAYQILTDNSKRKTFDYQFNHIAADYDFIKEKERQLRQKEASLIHRQIRRKLFIKGSVSLSAGLAIIALFSLSFDERSEPEIPPYHTNAAKYLAISKGEEKPVLQGKVVPSVHAASLKEIFDEQKINPVISYPVTTEQKSEPVKAEPKQEPVRLEGKEMTSTEMAEVLHLIEQEKTAQNNSSKCIKLFKSVDCNVENAFGIAGFFQKSGYVIAGRETKQKKIKGIHVECSSKFIEVTVGRIE